MPPAFWDVKNRAKLRERIKDEAGNWKFIGQAGSCVAARPTLYLLHTACEHPAPVYPRAHGADELVNSTHVVTYNAPEYALISIKVSCCAPYLPCPLEPKL
jgi:hypothetical protein